MEQMSETLKYLNGIFRTMQNDGSTLKTTDLQTALSRLEKENRELKATNREFDAIKMQLAQTQQQLRQLEGQHVLLEDEAAKLRLQLHRRDEVIASLMEKDAVRSAEIEKLQKMAKLKDDELLSMDMKDPATSVLCIKCKRSLDDLTNIKAALVGGGGSGGGGGGSGNGTNMSVMSLFSPDLLFCSEFTSRNQNDCSCHWFAVAFFAACKPHTYLRCIYRRTFAAVAVRTLPHSAAQPQTTQTQVPFCALLV